MVFPALLTLGPTADVPARLFAELSPAIRVSASAAERLDEDDYRTVLQAGFRTVWTERDVEAARRAGLNVLRPDGDGLTLHVRERETARVQLLEGEDAKAWPTRVSRDAIYLVPFAGPPVLTLENAPECVESLRYPWDRANSLRVASECEGPWRDRVIAYAKERWSAETIAERVRPWRDWGRRQRVWMAAVVTAVPRRMPNASRKAYLRDVASALAEAGLGRVYGDLEGRGGLFEGRPLRSDPSAVSAWTVAEDRR